MLNQLKTNLATIYDELNEKLIPTNIRKDVTILNVNGVLEQSGVACITTQQVDNYVVTKPDSGSYTFTLNSNGYYESNNKGVANSYALCKLSFNALYEGCSLVLDCINYAESNYDYGILSKLDTTLSSSTTADTNREYYFYGKSSSNVQRYVYSGIPKGNHFIYIKFRKDGSGDIGNDSFQFKVVDTIADYMNIKIYNSEQAMNTDINQLDHTYATIDIGNQVFRNIYCFDEETKVWNKTQSTEFTAGSYKTLQEFKDDTIHYGTDYTAIINDPQGETPINIDYIGEIKLGAFKDTVILDTPLTEQEIYHVDNVKGTEEDYWAKAVKIDLTYNKFKLEQYNETAMYEEGYENYVLEYSSTDGKTYTQIKNTFNTSNVYIHNYEERPLLGEYDKRIGNFLYTIGNVFSGIYYKSSATSSPTRLSNQLYCIAECLPNNYTVYANNGVISGSLFTPPTNDIFEARYKFEVYNKLKTLLENEQTYENKSLYLTNYNGKSLPVNKYGNLNEMYIDRSSIEDITFETKNIAGNIYIQNCSNLKKVDITVQSISNFYIRDNYNLETIKLAGTINSSDLSFSNNRKVKSIDMSGVSQGANLTSVGSLLDCCYEIEDSGIPQLDTSLVTSFAYAFRYCKKITVAPDYDYTNNKSLSYTFYGCTDLVDISNIAQQGPLTTISYMCNSCSNLTTVPQLDLSSFTTYNWANTFTNCSSLSDDSLNNIMATLSTAPTSITTNRTLKYAGLTAEQCYKCTTLSNYQNLIDNGWTAGYTDDELAAYAPTSE